MELRDRIFRLVAVSTLAVVLWVWANNATMETALIESTISVVLPRELRDTRELRSPREPFVAFVEGAGPAAALQEATRRLQAVRLTVGEGGMPDGREETVLPLKALLQRQLDAARVDVKIRSLDPAPPPLEVEALSRMMMAVVPRVAADGVQVEGGAVATPEQVEVFLPAEYDELRDRIRVVAALDPVLLAGRQSGRRYTETAPLRLALDDGTELPPDVRIVPASADVSFTIAARTVSTVLASASSSAPGVPVQIAAPPKDLERYAVTIDPKDSFLRNVTINAPPEVIEQIRQGRARIIAFVPLTSDDLDRAIVEGGKLLRPLVGGAGSGGAGGGGAGGAVAGPGILWQLPPGVTVESPGKTDYQIEQELNPGLPRREGILVTVKPRTAPKR